MHAKKAAGIVLAELHQKWPECDHARKSRDRKTHCDIGLGLNACERGFIVLYTTVPSLVTELKECESTKTLKSYQQWRFEKYDLVIADELGCISFDRAGADLLFSNLSLRTVGKSTIIAATLSFERWEEMFCGTSPRERSP